MFLRADFKLLFTVLSAFAEFDREQKNEKLQSARQWHRENVDGYRDGRKNKLTKKEQKLLYQRYKSNLETAQEIAESYNISRKTLCNCIKRCEQNNQR
ncbi:helix-turn-helix domain-containing protein [Enterococcus casseliflavus]|uniref:helix-turn-helix domain-containing protein n=1 Tax=Enterococcus TaxID=1350 RepID=UPI0035E2FB16